MRSSPAGSIQEVAIPSNAARNIVRERLDPKLLASVKLISGKNFHFTAAGQAANAQIALLVLIYPNETIAKLMANKIASRAGFFRNSKILTPFAYSQFSDQLVITFTENAANDVVVAVVKAFPERLKAAAVRK